MIESSQYIGLAIGIGMCLSLFLTEALGVTAGGVIVPGYIALFLHEPIQIIVTFSISFLVLLILRILSNFMEGLNFKFFFALLITVLLASSTN